jgi:hypothetical protein
MKSAPLGSGLLHAFAGHLDGVGVAQLVRREAAAHAGQAGGAS